MPLHAKLEVNGFRDVMLMTTTGIDITKALPVTGIWLELGPDTVPVVKLATFVEEVSVHSAPVEFNAEEMWSMLVIVAKGEKARRIAMEIEVANKRMRADINMADRILDRIIEALPK